MGSMNPRGLKSALEEIRDHIHDDDEDWWGQRADCGHSFHTTADDRPFGSPERWCPVCYSTWWATDGTHPDDATYAVEAVARKALAEA